ncbi:MAG: 3-phosphoshikimate 1-carboxyvinyltransferase [Thermodesulfobacteriota bacterium]|nr:3-phosphoshikimate 1-carboxyvinyltransferase [Thermodesulfobacteriota bacterium]
MIQIRPLADLDATVTIPGSKSFTHRALIVSALGEGESVLIHALRSEDTEYTVQALKRLGIQIFLEGDRLHVLGEGGRLKQEEGEIFIGNSGTSMRFLTALVALKKGTTLLDGNERMRKRPMADLLEGLRALGVKAYFREGNDCPPVMIESQGLLGGKATIRGEESSQFLSGLLMVAPYAQEDVTLEVTGHLASRPYVDITCEVMRDFGVRVHRDGNRFFSVKAGQRYHPRRYFVEGDASHASYFFSAAAVTRGKVRVKNFRPDSIQGDSGFLNILERMGCEVLRGDEWAEVHGKELKGIEVDMNEMPDLVPTLAVTSAFACGKTLIKNIGHLRLKESDRIGVLARELSRIGIQVEEGEDWLKIEGGRGHGAEIDPHNDHRIAMSFAIAGLVIPGIRIKEPQCVKKSFPDFWEVFGRLYL